MTHPNHPNVDQSDRVVPINLRQSGRTPTELLISTRVRKSPFWHLSHEAGCWRATVYNRIYHPRGYVKPEDGGAMVEYEALVNRVTMWNVAVERQIRVKGPDAEAFTDFVITPFSTNFSKLISSKLVSLISYKVVPGAAKFVPALQNPSVMPVPFILEVSYFIS